MTHSIVKPNALDFVILLTLSLIWGSAFGAIKIAVESSGPITVVAVRTLFGFLAIAVFLILNRSFHWPWRDIPYGRISAIAIIGTLIPFFLISWAEQYVDSAVAGLLNGAGPLITVLGAHFITRDELLTRGRLVGVLVGLAGMIILMRNGLSLVGNTSLIAQFGLILAFGCYAAGNLLVRQQTVLKPVHLTCSSLFLSSLISLPAAFYFESPNPAGWSMSVWAALLWLSFVSTAFAFSLRYVLIMRAGAGFTSNVGYLIPIIAVFIGYFLLDEKITLTTLLAMVIIIFGLFIMRKSGIKMRDNSRIKTRNNHV